MQQNIFIIHGAFGHPKENWFPWLKNELEKQGYAVFVPAFPTPENQSLENWLKAFRDYEKFLNEDSILVGHSIGSAFILNVLEGLKHPIKAAFLVAGFIGKLDSEEVDEINKSLTEKEFDWSKIKENCRQFTLYQSNNDPYVPVKKGKELERKLSAKLTLVKNAGHFNEKAGYTKFELLLEDIKKVLKKND